MSHGLQAVEMGTMLRGAMGEDDEMKVMLRHPSLHLMGTRRLPAGLLHHYFLISDGIPPAVTHVQCFVHLNRG